MDSICNETNRILSGMKMKRYTQLISTHVMALAIASLLLTEAQARTWTSADGADTYEGELKAYNPATGLVRVTLANGKEMVFSKSVLSPADIAYLNERGKVELPVVAKPKPVAPPAPKMAAAPPRKPSKKIDDDPENLVKPHDGKPADMDQPVQVFILLGQSNMLGFGNGGALKGLAPDKYPYLVDADGNWIVRKDVRNVFFNNGGLATNDWMSAGNRDKFGPELGIGNFLGQAIDAPVMILKACVGNRALGWDLLPPSAEGTGTKGKSYEGDSEYGNRQVKADRDGWYAGLQYDLDIGVAQEALRNLETYYPDAKEYEVAGFFWWQGCSEGKGNPAAYAKNLTYLFADLKKDFDAPNAKFVGATLGEQDKDSGLSPQMFEFADDHDDAEFFYSKPVSKGGSCGHYGGDAATYMNVGEGMGKTMVELLKK
jgi:hypothetical protein